MPEKQSPSLTGVSDKRGTSSGFSTCVAVTATVPHSQSRTETQFNILQKSKDEQSTDDEWIGVTHRNKCAHKPSPLTTAIVKKDQAEEEGETAIKCKDCNNQFTMPHVRRDTYVRKGLQIPRRCQVSIHDRKTQQNIASHKKPTGPIITEYSSFLNTLKSTTLIRPASTSHTYSPDVHEFPPLETAKPVTQHQKEREPNEENHDAPEQHPPGLKYVSAQKDEDTHEDITSDISNCAESLPPLPGRFWCSSFDTTQDSTLSWIPANYWDPQSQHTYDSAHEQSALLDPTASEDNSTLPTLEEGSVSEENTTRTPSVEGIS